MTALSLGMHITRTGCTLYTLDNHRIFGFVIQSDTSCFSAPECLGIMRYIHIDIAFNDFFL